MALSTVSRDLEISKQLHIDQCAFALRPFDAEDPAQADKAPLLVFMFMIMISNADKLGFKGR